VEVTELIREDDRVLGARLRDRIDGSAFAVRARVVVNATGVWLDHLRLPRTFPTIRPTKGTHIFLPRAKVGNRHAVALTTKYDGRLVFVLPWNDLTLVGTTDTDFRGDPNRVTPDTADVEYLLEATNDAFPEARVGRDDIVSAYAGLRPLLRHGRKDRSESEVSREHEVFLDPDGLISVAGGKFTTHRAMAEEVVDMVETRLGERRRNVASESTFGPPVRPLEEFLALGFDEPTALDLQVRYAPDQVARYLDTPAAGDPIVEGRHHVWAEVDIAVHEEMALTLTDVLVRRLGLFYEASDQAFEVAPEVASRMGKALGWDSDRASREVEEYRTLVTEHRAFRMDHDG